ncbi:MAG: hypothetical protein ETSY1_22590 [Candidatus Entotheonella factor]|uniref:Uncharacterized protein n=1 Tax=Entotheonella factor TaxID=1429438 RepID=W4LH74_ENTF1|nr:MAG: hypothetical protein ETSY1_22590 [Candidatus Entotheonella factor]
MEINIFALDISDVVQASFDSAAERSYEETL